MRDDFPAHVVKTLGLRAGHLCSNPDCRKPTSGPHSDDNKSTVIGEAAHVCAAAPGGPRYDASQTPAARAGIRNAIWLCSSCATLIDKDEARYTVAVLVGWRKDHEAQ